MKYVRVLAVLALVTCAQAEITSWNCADDGDGVIVMEDKEDIVWTYDIGLEEYTLEADCVQTDLYGLAGHVQGDFNAPSDPKVWIIQSIENDTTFAWSDYHIEIGMTKTFTIDDVFFPDGWAIPVVTAPVEGTMPNGAAGWVGSVDYDIGTGDEIAINGYGDFGLKVSFTGSVAFCTEQIPTPEPVTLALLGLGAMLIRRRR